MRRLSTVGASLAGSVGTRVCAVFPGQGSQYVGMGKELVKRFPSCRHVMEEADDALSFRLSSLMASGPLVRCP